MRASANLAGQKLTRSAERTCASISIMRIYCSAASRSRDICAAGSQMRARKGLEGAGPVRERWRTIGRDRLFLGRHHFSEGARQTLGQKDRVVAETEAAAWGKHQRSEHLAFEALDLA